MTSKFKCILTVVLLVFASVSVSKAQQTKGYGKYVNTFIGTAPLNDPKILGYELPKGWRSWAGLTFPGSSMPNAMVQLSPITEYGSGAGYEYEDDIIYGFAHTNKGHWNLCNIPIMPIWEGGIEAAKAAIENSNNTIEGKGRNPKEFGSKFSHKMENAAPGFYQVYLENYKVKVSLTSTLRSGFHRYEFAHNTGRQIIFDLGRANNRISNWEIEQVGKNVLKGSQLPGERVYFYAILNTDIVSLEKTGEDKAGGYARVKLSATNKGAVEVKIGLSYVSTENARENLEQEIGHKTFELVRQEATQTWDEILSKIELKGGTEKQKQLLYSSLYRSLLWPALRSDINGEYIDAKRNRTKSTDFNYYTEPSLWDTYRNKDVLLGLISPKVALDVIKSMKDVGDKTGFIPTFFHGDHGASSIAGAYLRGIDNFDVKGTYAILLRNANVSPGARPHLAEYITKGFISDPDIRNPEVETKAKAGVSKTLEYAYDDYSLAQMAIKLGDTANYKILMARSKNYKNMFDPATRFMRGKLENGEWIKPFDPQYPYYEYMYREANAWQVSFFAPHDMKGLIELYGGPAGFESKLDSLFTLPWNPKHIARNVETFIGQYCHGNQPDHEAPFAYTFIGKPEKTQKVLDNILNNLYGIGDKGLALSGMDDAGEMSAWYVLTALGLYTFSATDPEYLVTAPLFEEVKWSTSSGKTLTIKKPGGGRGITAIKVDGKLINGYFISHDLFKNGGTIEVVTK
ncbi:glycoside hydrolase family 92 protein [Pedobacter polaris]|uniref:Glycoside hydrolase family 92 protein n=1 Tax=Pedobacter polaris TaxID=2571273 RepID=A0A4U1CVE5_9SPHI|nr:GH92 family glycosyl hydrolase [Pedobacter polaris]TKC09878.1 glycoside hydrolase family 92 protein [Pedobacter polaris]